MIKENWIALPYREGKPGERWHIERKKIEEGKLAVIEYLREDGQWTEDSLEEVALFRTRREAEEFADKWVGEQWN